jgi:hypothetical protein
MLAHLRTEAYPKYGQQIYPSGQGNEGTITVEKNDESLRQAHEALKRISRDRP